jgi:hypothetical protein
VRAGRLRPLHAAGDLVLEKRAPGAGARVERDPALLLDLLLSTL